VSDIQEDRFTDHPNRLPSLFAVYYAVLLGHSARIVENLNRVIEVDAVLVSIALGLPLVPLE
jgi:hypothetical protein